MRKNLKNNLEFVSIIIPCRDEEKYIGGCLDSIIANDFPKDSLEVLVVDGMSEDRTREIVERYIKQYPFIRLLQNNKKITPVALNIGIRQAKGEIIIRMDAHTTYEKKYISKCLKYLKEYNADNVGGMWKIIPRENTLVSKAIVLASSHPFGVGNAYYRFVSKEPRWVDTVPFFCCKKRVFDKIGLFNENLTRGQDMELNLRLKKRGGKILLVPEIVSYYHARSNFRAFCKHNFVNGVWAIYPMKFVKHMPVSWRHLVPLIFVLSLMTFGILGLFFPLFFWVFLAIFGLYLLINIYSSIKIGLKQKSFKYLFIIPIVFGALHISYGLGSIFGLLKVLSSKQFWRKSTV